MKFFNNFSLRMQQKVVLFMLVVVKQKSSFSFRIRCVGLLVMAG